MKVLVIGNCPTRAYVEFFQNCLPEWEVRSVLTVQAEKWVEEGHEGFLTYLSSIDVIAGLTNRSTIINELLPKKVKHIFVPSFDFFGLHPDSIFLRGIESPLGLGVIHSKIVSSSYVMGNNIGSTVALFNKDHFKKLGYTTHYLQDKNRVINKFKKEGSIDITEAFSRWSKDGNFLYTVNHPETKVFFDIICLAFEFHYPGLLNKITIETARKKVDDYLGRGIVWPVYPEISDALGISESTYEWRTSAIHEEPKFLNLMDFVTESFKRYSDNGGLTEDQKNHIGGNEKIKLYSGM